MNKKITTVITKTVKEILSEISKINKRKAEILILRYGLEQIKPLTLEAVGILKGGITRERVRQLEKSAMQMCELSLARKKLSANFTLLENELNQLGGVCSESSFLLKISEDKIVQNQIKFCLNLCTNIIQIKESGYFNSCLSLGNRYQKVFHTINNFYNMIDIHETIEEDRVIKIVSKMLELDPVKDYKKVLNILSTSKKLGKNKCKEWGKMSSFLVNPNNVADYLYILLKEKETPIHFNDLVKEACSRFDLNNATATFHNALILDKRFVKAGRGLYTIAGRKYSNKTILELTIEMLKEGPRKIKEVKKSILEKKIVKISSIHCIINDNVDKYFKLDFPFKGFMSLKDS